MDAGVIASLLFAISAPLLDFLEKGAISRLAETTPVQRAAEQTGATFPEIAGLERTLLEWSDHETFRNLIDSFREGIRPELGDDTIAEQFAEASRFYFGEDTIPKAREVVSGFLRSLKNELYTSSEGTALLAARMETLHSEMLASSERESDRVITEVVSAIGEVAADLPASLSPGASRPPEEEAIAAQLDVVRDLIREGKTESAADLLAHIEPKAIETELSDDSRFRLALNAGSVALELGEPREALKRYERALEIKPSDVKAMCAAAKTHLVLGQPAEALRSADEALTTDSTSVNALGMRLLALHHLDRDDEVEDAIVQSADLLDSALGSAMLGELRLSQGRIDEAVNLLRAGLSSDEVKLPYVRMLLGVALVNTVTRQGEVSNEQSRPEDANRTALLEADKYFTRALEDMATSADRKTYLDTLATRAATRALLGNRSAAIDDCERVLSENSTHPLALQNKARLLLLLGNAAGAIELIDRMPEPRSLDVVLLSASALLKLDRAAEALARTEHLLDKSVDDESQIQIAAVILKSEAELGISVRSEEVLRRLEDAWPAHPLALDVRAEAAEREGNPRKGIELLEQAIRLASPHFGRALRYDLAGMQYGSDDFAGAVATYRQDPPPVDHPEYRNYLAALLRAGHLGEVVRLAAEARRQIGISRLAEIEAHVLELIGDLAGAQALLEALSEQRDSPVEVRLRLLSLRLRIGNRSGAKESISRIQVDEVWNDPNQLLDLAEASLILELPDALELAFRARRIGFDSPIVHKRYVTIFLNREHIDDDLLHPQTVDVGCTVHMRRGDEERALTILSDDDASRSRNEIGPGDELASRVIGLRVGAELSIGVGPAATTYTIDRIQSKLVHAFQETFMNFSVWFPEDSDLMRVDVRENDLSKVLLMVDERYQFVKQVIALYRTKPITLGVVGELLNTSLVDVWTGLVGIEGEQLLASQGSEDEARHHGSLIENGPVLTLDIVALLTFAHLDLLDRLADAFRVAVPQSALTELRLHHAKSFEGAVPSGSLSKRGDTYTHDEFTAEGIERASSFIKGIINFIEIRADVEPAKGALDLEPGEYARLQEVLGGSSVDAIVVAKDREALLLSDDLRLRQVAITEAGVEGVWTKPVLDYLVTKEGISQDEYLLALRKLFLSNYRHPRITAREIHDLIERDQFELTSETTALLRAALGPDYSVQSVLNVAAELIASTFREPILQQTMDALLAVILTCVVLTRPNPRQQLEKLAQRLQVLLRLDPLGINRLMEYMTAWAAAHYI